jgi:DNA gyrase/topoisomerase IV subunit B
MIMSDQDHDGSHIKVPAERSSHNCSCSSITPHIYLFSSYLVIQGLVVNLIHHFWPSLLAVPGFLQQFITPIVKATKGKEELAFYTVPQYTQWKEDKAAESTSGKLTGWAIKYYKGQRRTRRAVV